MQRSLGQINFEAYSRSRNGKDYQGQPIPAWEDVKLEIQLAWEEGAHAVIWDSANTNEAWLALKSAYETLKEAKPNDKSENDRLHAIAITKMQDQLAHFKFWILDGGI